MTAMVNFLLFIFFFYTRVLTLINPFTYLSDTFLFFVVPIVHRTLSVSFGVSHTNLMLAGFSTMQFLKPDNPQTFILKSLFTVR